MFGFHRLLEFPRLRFVFQFSRRGYQARFDAERPPRYVYRWDSRLPLKIAVEGFRPWNLGGTATLFEHDTGLLANGDRAPPHSCFISTGEYGFIQNPRASLVWTGGFLYKIDTQKIDREKMTWVHLEFDALRKELPPQWADQLKWAVEGGVPADAVVSWMPGQKATLAWNLLAKEKDFEPLGVMPTGLTANGKTFLEQTGKRSEEYLKGVIPAEGDLVGWNPLPAVPPQEVLDELIKIKFLVATCDCKR